MKRKILIAVLVLMFLVPSCLVFAELMNITTAGVDGNWVIYDQSKNIIATWDAANRKLTFPSGSNLTVQSGGTATLTGATITGGTFASPTLTTPTITSPTIATPSFTLGVSTKYYSVAETDWTLSASEQATTILIISSGSDGIPLYIIAPATAGKIYIVRVEGGSPQCATATIKVAGKTGVKVALNKTAMVYYDAIAGDYRRVTADQTNY